MATLELASAQRGKRRLRHFRSFLVITATVTMATATAAVMAASFGPVRYDPGSDELIVTMTYDGTNPDHHFSIQWGPCRKVEQDRQVHQLIDVSILDDQWNDAATKTFTETVRIPLANVSCRPATVTLRTAPDFYESLDIPARP